MPRLGPRYLKRENGELFSYFTSCLLNSNEVSPPLCHDVHPSQCFPEVQRKELYCPHPNRDELEKNFSIHL